MNKNWERLVYVVVLAAVTGFLDHRAKERSESVQKQATKYTAWVHEHTGAATAPAETWGR